MRRLSLVLLAVALLAAPACGGDDDAGASGPARAAACPKAWHAGWQKLANRIQAPVYCPSWLPDPLTGEIGGPWNTINSVDPDGSYLIGFLWQERESGEIHVNLRGYPGRTAIPTCIDTYTAGGKTRRAEIPCFSDPQGATRIGAIRATLYTVGRDADQWHLTYAWRRNGSLYTLSEHVARPFSQKRVEQNLRRMLERLVLVRPKAS